MLTFKLISFKDGYYHYEYYPQGNKDDIGTLIFNPETGDIKKRVDPEFASFYYLHFLSGLRDEDGNYKTEGMVAWY